MKIKYENIILCLVLFLVLALVINLQVNDFTEALLLAWFPYTILMLKVPVVEAGDKRQ